jgi:L-threonylcarbamoyladenylate synthase
METQIIDLNDLEKAATLLLSGSIVAFPTETVYGLGASIFLEEAIRKIFIAKGRPSDNPLIAHIADLDSLEQIAQDIPSVFYQLANKFFPGPLTLIVPKRQEVPSIVSAGLNTVAVRMPNHQTARDLIRLVGTPLVAPSANLSGKPSSTEVSHVLDDFSGKIAGVVKGEASHIGIESTVVSLMDGKVEILRPGAISQEQIEDCLGMKISVFSQVKGSNETLPSPGMKYRHYAPNAKVHVFYSLEEAVLSYEKSIESKKMVLSSHALDKVFTLPLNQSSFYSNLRLADKEGYTEVFIVCDFETQSNKGLMNRILKSSGN